MDLSEVIEGLVRLARELYGPGPVPLHRPLFTGNERRYVMDAIDSNYVSTIGERVNDFEERIRSFVGTSCAVATVNGTSALHVALVVAGVRPGDEVITQALTFVATANAISYIGARPVFIDVDCDTMGMSPSALRGWLWSNAEIRKNATFNRKTKARISACVPMHTFGLPCRVDEIAAVCAEFGIPVVEDAAESLGSFLGSRHTGRYGCMATLSFNGNKIITTGGGGMIITDDRSLADRARHLSTTAKVPHPWEFWHNEIGYNYRLPNLNAALGCAQVEQIKMFLDRKARVAARYRAFCAQYGLNYVDGLPSARPNYWLNAIKFSDRQARDTVLRQTNSQGIMTRPLWRLMTELPPFAKCEHDGLPNSRALESCIVALPSSVPDRMVETIGC